VSTITSADVAVDAQPRSTRQSWVSLDLVVLVAASVVMALPFLLLHHVNTIDGPGHVLGGRLLGNLGNTALFHHYYVNSITIAPNGLTDALLGVLMAVVSPTWSEKLVAIGYIIAFPLAVRFAIRSVNPSAGWLALLSLPFTINYLFLYGFYDFCYAMIGAFVAIALMIRWRGRWNAWRVVVLAVVLVLTLGSHLVPWVMAAVIIGVLALTDAISQFRAGRLDQVPDVHDGALTEDPRHSGKLWRDLYPPVLAVIPSAVLTALFVLSDNTGTGAVQRKSLKTLVEGLATLTLPIVTYSRLEIAAALLTVLVLLVLLVMSIAALRRGELSTLSIGLGVSVLVCIVIYFASPDFIGTGGLLNDRFSLFPPLMLLLACASVPTPPGIWRSAGLVGLVAALLLAGIRLPTQVRYDRQVTEYLMVERAIPPGQTLVALRFSVFSPPLGDQRFKQGDPLSHESSRVAADNGDVDLRDFEAQVPYFPHRFRPQLEQLAQRYLYDYDVPPHANLSAYNNASGRAVDYVLLVGLNQASAEVRNAPATRALEQVLQRDYVHVMTTQPTGLVELYRLRQDVRATSGALQSP
jgi:hypothetical protein